MMLKSKYAKVRLNIECDEVCKCSDDLIVLIHLLIENRNKKNICSKSKDLIMATSTDFFVLYCNECEKFYYLKTIDFITSRTDIENIEEIQVLTKEEAFKKVEDLSNQAKEYEFERFPTVFFLDNNRIVLKEVIDNDEQCLKVMYFNNQEKLHRLHYFY